MFYFLTADLPKSNVVDYFNFCFLKMERFTYEEGL